MIKTSLYPVIQACFVAVTFTFYGLALVELRRALLHSPLPPDRKKKILWSVRMGLLAWGVVISLLSITGFFEDFSTVPPKMAIVFVVPLLTLLWATFSKTASEVLPYVRPEVIIRLQVFRVFVEILLWLLFIRHLLPVQMTFEGRNWDVLSGVSAPIVAYLLIKSNWPRSAVVLWNVAGLLLLLNIIVIAALSLPTPFRVFMNEPANAIVAHFPIVWLPGFLVPLAYGLHFFSLRQAYLKKQPT